MIKLSWYFWGCAVQGLTGFYFPNITEHQAWARSAIFVMVSIILMIIAYWKTNETQ